MKKLLGAIALSFAATTVLANEINITIPDDVEVQSDSILYQCGEETVSATYYNAGEISLVALEMEETTIVAANVISASGARYAGGPYIWWTKGATAALYNLMEDPEQENPQSCVEQ